MKPNLLFISHRIPAPPNKGDKIRSYNFIRSLSRKYDIHLAFLVDEKDDIQHIDMLRSYTKSIAWEQITPKTKKITGTIQSLLRMQPVSIPYFYSRNLQKKIDLLLEQNAIECVFCFSSPTAEYIFKSSHIHGKLEKVTKVMDLIDVDSRKWLQYSTGTNPPMSWIYKRESQLLQEYEKKIARDFDSTLLVSSTELNLFKSFCNEKSTYAVSNGVDLQYFSPQRQQPKTDDRFVLSFVGAMDYWPNIEGAVWFVNNIFPRIRDQIPQAEFYIVGSRPTEKVLQLQETPGVHVTGFVADIREYLIMSDVCVAPLLIARGIQNKVLEAMAMGKPVVCTPEALEGIDASPERDVCIAGTATEFAQKTASLLQDEVTRTQMAVRARQCVEQKYSWENSFRQLEQILHKRNSLNG